MAGEYKGVAGSVPVDANGTSLADTTTSALKVVSVDSTGTALSGGGGSRVELLASGTSTDVATAQTTIASWTMPSWAHSFRVEWRIDAAVVGSAGNMNMQVGAYDLTGTNLISYTNLTAFSPAATNAGVLLGGMIYGGTANAAGGSGGYWTVGMPFITSTMKLTRTIATNPMTSISMSWRVYGIGG